MVHQSKSCNICNNATYIAWQNYNENDIATKDVNNVVKLITIQVLTYLHTYIG